MPDVQGFQVTPTTVDANGIQHFLISGLITDSESGAVLRDYTDANAVPYPDVLATLSTEQASELAQQVATWLFALLVEPTLPTQ